VPRHLAQPLRIAEHRTDLRIDVDEDGQLTGLPCRHQHVGGRTHHVAEIHVPAGQAQAARRGTRRLEQVVDDLRLRRGMAFHGGERVRLAIVSQRAAADHAGVALDRGQRRPQLARHRGKELMVRLRRRVRFGARLPEVGRCAADTPR
jgi:hypothetical protein